MLVEQIGSLYPDVDVNKLYSEAKSFYNNLVYKNFYWFVDVSSMISSEGGKASLVRNLVMEALLHHPDWGKGFTEYSKYLQNSYGANRMENEVLHWEQFGRDDGDNRQWEPSYEATFGDNLHTSDLDYRSEARPSYAVRFEPYSGKLTTNALRYLDRLSDNDKDILDTFAYVGNMREAERFASAKVGRGAGILGHLRRLLGLAPRRPRTTKLQ